MNMKHPYPGHLDGALSHLEVLEVYALSSMLRDQDAAAAAMALGLQLFPGRPARAVAALVLTGSTRPLERLGPAERLEADELGRAVVRCGVPGDDRRWARHLVDTLAQTRLVGIVADTLRWAADGLEAGRPVRAVYAAVESTMRLLLGELPATAAALLAEQGGNS